MKNCLQLSARCGLKRELDILRTSHPTLLFTWGLRQPKVLVPRDAATWFLQNYQSDKRGARAPDSLLFLVESMRQLKDTNRACIALAEFSETYAAEAAGRLRAQYDQLRGAVKCN